MSIQPKVIWDITRYENTHGKRPRGRGMWWFAVANIEYEAPHAMNYSDAKRWLRNDIAPMFGNGDDTITVQVLP